MDEKPPFDFVRASFWLIASIIWVHCLIVLMGAVECLWLKHINTEHVCDPSGKLSDLLAAGLAAALAFAGVRGGRDK
jgi:hypothetical protein